jgi:N,N'-diacetyllegionaminate synthase
MRKKLKDYGLRTNNPTYIIAEVGINHGGDLELAKKLISSAANSGADAVKFQTYLTEKRCPPNKPEVFAILKRCELPFAAFKTLKQHADKCGIQFFSTPFDEESVDCLESIGCELYKIASFDIVNSKLLKTIAAMGKPVILSVGMANVEEIKSAYNLLRKGTRKISVLHCISSYPTNEEDARLENIRALEETFDCVIGQSDHTTDIVVPLYAVAAGAQVLEKHYSLNGQKDCVDGPVSITEDQMKKLVSETRRLEKILGKKEFGVRAAEKGIVAFRRKSK